MGEVRGGGTKSGKLEFMHEDIRMMHVYVYVLKRPKV